MCGYQADSHVHENSDEESYICHGCCEPFSASEFDVVDDEFNSRRPMCPSCQQAARVDNAECENGCDAPATHEVEFGFVCDDCFEHYADGYRERE